MPRAKGCPLLASSIRRNKLRPRGKSNAEVHRVPWRGSAPESVSRLQAPEAADRLPCPQLTGTRLGSTFRHVRDGAEGCGIAKDIAAITPEPRRTDRSGAPLGGH